MLSSTFLKTSGVSSKFTSVLLLQHTGGSSKVKAIGAQQTVRPTMNTKFLYGDNAKRNILLVGTSGRGKSATGNSIFGSPVFETTDSMAVDLDSIVCQTREVDGLKLTICDALTIRDERMLKIEAQADIQARLKKCFDTCPEGFHFIIFVYSYTDRVTPEENVAAEVLIDAFGTRFLTEQAVFVFAHGENFDLQRKMRGGPDFDIWYRSTQDPLLQKVSRNMKAFMFYNIQTEKMATQRQEILDIVHSCYMCVRREQRGYIVVEVKSNNSKSSKQQRLQSLSLTESMKRKSENNQIADTDRDENSAIGPNVKSQRQSEKENLKRQRMDNEAASASDDRHNLSSRTKSLERVSISEEAPIACQEDTGCKDAIPEANDCHDARDQTQSLSSEPNHKGTGEDTATMAKIGKQDSTNQTSYAGNPTSSKEWNLILICSNKWTLKELRNTLLGGEKPRKFPWKIEGSSLTIMDGRKLLSGKKKLQKRENILKDCFEKFSNIFHAIVFVHSQMNKLKRTEKKTVTYLKGMLGENFIKEHCILLSPFGKKNSRKSHTSESCHKQDESKLEALITECQNRVVVFHKSTPEKREEFLNDLTLCTQKIGRPYTYEMFEEASYASTTFIKDKQSSQGKDEPVFS